MEPEGVSGLLFWGCEWWGGMSRGRGGRERGARKQRVVQSFGRSEEGEGREGKFTELG